MRIYNIDTRDSAEWCYNIPPTTFIIPQLHAHPQEVITQQVIATLTYMTHISLVACESSAAKATLALEIVAGVATV